MRGIPPPPREGIPRVGTPGTPSPRSNFRRFRRGFWATEQAKAARCWVTEPILCKFFYQNTAHNHHVGAICADGKKVQTITCNWRMCLVCQWRCAYPQIVCVVQRQLQGPRLLFVRHHRTYDVITQSKSCIKNKWFRYTAGHPAPRSLGLFCRSAPQIAYFWSQPWGPTPQLCIPYARLDQKVQFWTYLDHPELTRRVSD